VRNPTIVVAAKSAVLLNDGGSPCFRDRCPLASTLLKLTGGGVMWSALFPPNENQLDRGFRVLVGGVLLFLAVTGVTAWGYVGLLPLVTGLVGSCPAYRLLGVNTCKR
jgi:hypothetical protein